MTKYYTDEGLEALTNRLKTYVHLHQILSESDYPASYQMFGFPEFRVNSKSDCESKITELKTILGVEITLL